MTQPTNSAGYPIEMVEIMLRVGITKKALVLPLATESDKHDMRNRFYALRNALRKEKYSEIDTVASVRFCICPEGLRIESTARLNKDSLQAGLEAAVAAMNQDDSTGASPAASQAPLPYSLDGKSAVVASDAAGPTVDDLLLENLAAEDGQLTLSPAAASLFPATPTQPTNGATNVQSLTKAS